MKYWTDVDIKDWPKLYECYQKNFRDPTEQWIFRGLAEATYDLETTLERVSDRFGVGRNGELEHNMIRHFKRHAHVYLNNPPNDNDTIEWLALMRHFGSPTRLMDWTYSFFVALFFAVEHATNDCAVWAINLEWLKKKVESTDKVDFESIRNIDRRLKSDYFFQRVFNRQPPIALVYSLNPEKLNERLIVQQGLFLVPGDISVSFKDNLDAVCNIPEAVDYVWKIIIDKDVELRREILLYLHRMNINKASLFPGLDGFAGSFETRLANDKIFFPKEDGFNP